jgi:hypothetical protein
MYSSRDSRVKVVGVTAALTAAAAAGYYAYDQYTKRYPKYQEQLSLYKEVGGCSGRRSLVCGTHPRAEMEKLEDDMLKQVRPAGWVNAAVCITSSVGRWHTMRVWGALCFLTLQHANTCYGAAMQMHDSLDKANGSSILMLPTHVLKLPTG